MLDIHISEGEAVSTWFECFAVAFRLRSVGVDAQLLIRSSSVGAWERGMSQPVVHRVTEPDVVRQIFYSMTDFCAPYSLFLVPQRIVVR